MRPCPRLIGLLLALPLASLHGTAEAQPADGSAPATTETEAAPAAAPVNPVQYGVGFRLRNVRIPNAELELFVDRSAGGASNLGLGVDFIRRRGDLELQLGFEYEKITVGDGVWIKSGDNVAAGAEADYILKPDDAPNGDSLGWFTIEFTFLNHARINDQFSIRYGGGAGLGIVTGGLYRYDMICNNATNEMPEPGCVPPRFQGTGTYSSGDSPKKYELPPVFPVVNAIIGVQFKPNDSVTINLEGGIRTLLFFGLSGAYFF